MKSVLAVFGIVLFSMTGAAQATVMCSQKRASDCFVGKFGLVANPADSRTKLLANDFAYVDPRGVGWQTNRGDATNGASIPALFHGIIGGPWEDKFIRAAVIHDRYCDEDNLRRVRDWRQTHRMFYHALLVSEVPRLKAKLMYYAVYVFGPSWGHLHKGSGCSLVGSNCIQDVNGGAWEWEFRDARYDTDEAASQVDRVRQIIEADPSPEGPSLEALEALAEQLNPVDPYWTAPHEPPVWRGSQPGSGYAVE